MQKTRLLAGALALIAVGAGLTACGPSPSQAANHSSMDRVKGMSLNAMSSSDRAITRHDSKAGSGAGSRQKPVGYRSGSDIGSVVSHGHRWGHGRSQEWNPGGGHGWSPGQGHNPGNGQGQYVLQPMPTGTVTISQLPDRQLQARVDMFGLTPGSAHQVSIVDNVAHKVQFPSLTANAAGEADATLTSLNAVTWPPEPSDFVVHLGDSITDPMAAQPIAHAPLPPRFAVGFTLPLNAVDIGPFGPDRPSGRTTISYNAAARTLSVTVTASGLSPGPHAAHIHLGSCQSQGPVQYMLADFVADRDGNIVNQTRTVSDVPAIPAPSSWYLNLHQGGMNQILANGTPTLLFRPLLCTDISSVANVGASTPPPSPTHQPTHW